MVVFRHFYLFFLLFHPNCYLLIYFVYWNPQKIVKREGLIQARFVVLFHTLIWINQHSCLCVLASMFRLNSMFWICVVYVGDKNGIIVWLLFHNLPNKGTPWKFWLDLRFPRNFKQKWTLKRLSFDRGHFNLTFLKGEGLLIIPEWI